ncbi:unnamed protein product [Eruca vesicaria subsp. sativa]|uniref:Uncharacterized protein n=1 Tax=Eruca vesicaria subsp. sativa TaxID=29727 RepID=A0ABC8JN88_ERUVS|nr:unnamed protein product [Eruca vesicaria subsp. sativa]
MESKSTSGGGGGGVVRRKGTLSRYEPYALVTENKEKEEEGVVQLGVELSLRVAEFMFLLCDDKKVMLLFCFMICKVGTPDDPVSERLLRVMHHVYTNEIVSKKRLHKKSICPSRSVHCGLIGSAWNDLDYVIRYLHGLAYKLLIRKQRCFPNFRHDRLDTVAIKRLLIKKLDDKLRCAKDASEANGFARETLESTVSETWKSLFFNEEEEEDVVVVGEDAKATKIRLLRDLFHPLFGESWEPKWVRPSQSPLYTIGKDFEKQEEMREEAMRLGVELSLYVAESMFLMCDDIRSVLLFCNRLLSAVVKDLKQQQPPQDSPVTERIVRVFHYVYSKHIKPRVFHYGGRSVQWKLAMASFEDFHVGIRDLDVFVRQGTPTSSIHKALKNVEEKLRCAKAVSKANGFTRNAMESDILIMWKSLFDKPTEDLWALKMMRVGILNDMFHPLLKEIAEENSLRHSFTCLNIYN